MATSDNQMARAFCGASPSDRESVRGLVGNDDLEGGAGIDFEARFGEQTGGRVALSRQVCLQRECHHPENNGVAAGWVEQ